MILGILQFSNDELTLICGVILAVLAAVISIIENKKSKFTPLYLLVLVLSVIGLFLSYGSNIEEKYRLQDEIIRLKAIENSTKKIDTTTTAIDTTTRNIQSAVSELKVVSENLSKTSVRLEDEILLAARQLKRNSLPIRDSFLLNTSVRLKLSTQQIFEETKIDVSVSSGVSAFNLWVMEHLDYINISVGVVPSTNYPNRSEYSSALNFVNEYSISDLSTKYNRNKSPRIRVAYNPETEVLKISFVGLRIAVYRGNSAVTSYLDLCGSDFVTSVHLLPKPRNMLNTHLYEIETMYMKGGGFEFNLKLHDEYMSAVGDLFTGDIEGKICWNKD